jgi:O-antigen/teichoic acid export membrane protein
VKSEFSKTLGFGLLRLISSLLQLFISLVRNKLISSIYGATGLGLYSSYQSSLNLITTLSNLHISNSAVKEIPRHLANQNLKQALTYYQVSQLLLIGLGSVGSIAIFIFSSSLSQIVFGTHAYQTGFQILSLTIVFNQLASAQGVWMRATGAHKAMFYNNLASTLTSFLVSILLFLNFPTYGIPLSIAFNSIINFFSVYLFSSGGSFSSFPIWKKEYFKEAKSLLKNGKYLTLLDVSKSISENFLRIFLVKFKNIEAVGQYTAGFSILQLSIGTITNSLNMDFTRELAFNQSNPRKVVSLMRNHIYLSQLILAPVLALLVIQVEWIVSLLFSNQFSAAIPLIMIGTLGITLEKIYYPISQYLYLFKRTRVYFKIQIIGILIYTLLASLFFIEWGLAGVGLAFLIQQLTYLLLGFYRIREDISFKDLLPFHPSIYFQHVVFFFIVWIQWIKVDFLWLSYVGLCGIIGLSLKEFWSIKKRKG